jgi:hypothetical protein
MSSKSRLRTSSVEDNGATHGAEPIPARPKASRPIKKATAPTAGPTEPKKKGRAKKEPAQTPASKDEALLHEAVENPGSVEPSVEEIPEAPMLDEDIVPKIAECTLENDDPGTEVPRPPESMSVKLGRPSPHLFVQFYPDRTLNTALLDFRRTRDSSAEYYFVPDAKLRSAVKKYLKNVKVLLVADMVAGSEPFLWIVARSEMSPYYNTVSRILGQGDKALKDWVYRIGTPDVKNRARICPLRHRLRTPEDPTPILPSREIGVLLYEALGNERVIKAADHPVYEALIAGSDL